MIIAYHAIFTTYGTWLPNDPRGSFSQQIYNNELKALAPILYDRQDPQPPLGELRAFWTAARPCLSRPPYFIHNGTRPVVATAFRTVVQRLGMVVFACSIMNDHVHILVMRGRHRIEYLVNQFKGAATKALGLSRTPWAREAWKVFLDDWAAVQAAHEYIEANPAASGLPPQRWPFITPLEMAWRLESGEDINASTNSNTNTGGRTDRR